LAGAALAPVDGSVALSFESRASQPGELVVVTIDAPGMNGAKGRIHVRAFDRDVKTFANGDHRWQALVGVDLDVKPGTYPISAVLDDDAAHPKASRNLVVAPKPSRPRRLPVTPDCAPPPASEAARIEADAKLLERTWAAAAPERLWTPFSAPVP